MKKFNRFKGQVIPLPLKDVDTDMIIPAQYMTSVSVGGYGKHLFTRLKNADENFIFNHPEYQSAEILVSDTNFGCGSSREHAVWALLEAGIKTVIAPSFSDIFFNNSAKNGLLLIQLPKETVDQLMLEAQRDLVYLHVDLENQHVTHTSGDKWHFDYDPFHKHCLLNGLDQLEYLYSQMDKIDEYDKTRVCFIEEKQ